jgi:ATP-dependent DNA helicase RecG
MQLTDIKGVGDAYRKKLNALEIFSVNDLADFLPNGYIDFRSYTPTEEIAVGQYIFVKCEVIRSEFNPRKRVVKAVLNVMDGGIIEEKTDQKTEKKDEKTASKTDEISQKIDEKTGQNTYKIDGKTSENTRKISEKDAQKTDKISQKIDEKSNEMSKKTGEKTSEKEYKISQISNEKEYKISQKIGEKTGKKTDKTGIVLSAFWFNQPYIKDKIKAGEYIFFGKATEFDGKISLTNPIFEPAEAPKALKGIMPIYRTKGLISQGNMRKFLQNALEFCRFESVSEYSNDKNTSGKYGIPAEKSLTKGGIPVEKSFIKSDISVEKNLNEGGILTEKNTLNENKNNGMTLNEAYKKAHFPNDIEEARSAQRRLAREDFVRLIFTYKALRSRSKRREGFENTVILKDKRSGEVAAYGSFADTKILKNYLSALPFELTDSQKNALEDAVSDMTSPLYMNRLLMGDVGSGKTVVAFAAAYFAVKSGVQAAVLAPTELLSRQHYKTATGLLEPLGVRVRFLAASATPSEKKDAQKGLKDGSVDVVVGTHSLFSAGVEYKKLGLIVIDEQHKFGVSEKNALKEKSKNADVLTLSATPIPRALSLALLGELDVSTIERRSKIDELIATRIVPERKKNDMFEYIKRRAEEGRQAYIVASRIEDAEGIEVDTVKNLYKELKEGIFKDISVAVLHGKTGKIEKEKIMNDFRSGAVKVLIGTTVVEVGIDVKNASVMAIMNAEGYGLSTLHQLRGRVGRGDEKSYCFLHTAKEDNPRLRALLECADGFSVAERDFELRGGGNFLGERQSGSFERLNEYIVDIDKELIAEAKKIAEKIPLNEETERILRDMNYQKYYNVIKNTVLM